jgi:hypothetical protein
VEGQQASLLSFSADAYLNEIGITSPLQPDENTSNGNRVDDDRIVDNDGGDVELFALFMRSLKVPPSQCRSRDHARRERGQHGVRMRPDAGSATRGQS